MKGLAQGPQIIYHATEMASNFLALAIVHEWKIQLPMKANKHRHIIQERKIETVQLDY